MQARVESAEAHWDEFREAWTLSLGVRGPFRTNLVMGPKDWAQLLSKLGGRIRHAPQSELDAKFAAEEVRRLIRLDRNPVIETSKLDNIRISGQKKQSGKKETREDKKMSDATDRRKLELKLTISRGTRTEARCRWDVARMGQALREGLIPKDSEGAEAIIGARVLRYVEKEVEMEEEQSDGTKKTVKKKVKEPEWDDRDQPVGPFSGKLPDPNNGYGEHIAFIPEVRDIFRKGKGNRPFRIMDFDEAKLDLFITDGIDIEAAQNWVDEAFERLPWISTFKGSKLNDKAFEK